MRRRIWLRPGELWVGTLGIFWGRITGVELPSGRFIGLSALPQRSAASKFMKGE